jgi:membrane-bound ClpP family serine protease
MNKRLTSTRLMLAIVSNILQLLALWIIWRWILPEFNIRLSVIVLITVMAAWAVFGTWLFLFTTRVLKKQAQVGQTSMVGTTGKVITKLAPEGMVKINGELWRARSTEGDISIGEDIIVSGEERLKLLVRRSGEPVTKH